MYYSKIKNGFYDESVHGNRKVFIQDPDWVRPKKEIPSPDWIYDESDPDAVAPMITVTDMDAVPAQVEVLNPDCKIPADAVEITEAEYCALIEGQSSGKSITADETGRPVLVEPKSLWTLEDFKSAKRVEIRSAYAEAETAPVELDGVQWHGGLDSAIKLDSALRFSQNAGLESIVIYDVNNEGYELPLADALQVVTAVANTYQQTLSKKQRLMRMIYQADTVAMVEAITW